MTHSLPVLSLFALQESSDPGFAVGGVVLLLMVLVGLAFTLFWAWMLVTAARQEQWGWFVAMLLIGFLAIVYFLAAYRPEERRVQRRRRTAR